MEIAADANGAPPPPPSNTTIPSARLFRRRHAGGGVAGGRKREGRGVVVVAGGGNTANNPHSHPSNQLPWQQEPRQKTKSLSSPAIIGTATCTLQSLRCVVVEVPRSAHKHLPPLSAAAARVVTRSSAAISPNTPLPPLRWCRGLLFRSASSTLVVFSHPCKKKKVRKRRKGEGKMEGGGGGQEGVEMEMAHGLRGVGGKTEILAKSIVAAQSANIGLKAQNPNAGLLCHPLLFNSRHPFAHV